MRHRFWLGFSLAVLAPWTYANGAISVEQLSDVNTLAAGGSFNVVIEKSNHPSLTVMTNALIPIRRTVSNHTLYLQGPELPPPTNHRATVIVTLPKLSKLIVYGPTHLSGKWESNRNLIIKSYGYGSISLKGIIKVSRIDQTGPNHIDLQWVNSDALSVHSEQGGVIKLAGVARSVSAYLKDDSVFNGEYLRANTVRVQAKERGAAYVYPVTTLSAFASGLGNIYYYTHPQNITRESSESGNILQMAWRP